MTARKTSLVLRVCREDMSSSHSFVWPGVGETARAPDWRNDTNCGHGLHGWLHGVGDATVCSYVDDPNSKWLVVAVEHDTIVHLDGKCKFPEGVVVCVGDKRTATDYLLANEPAALGLPVIGATVSRGDNGTSTSGNYGTSTSGDGGTSTSGDGGTSTSGDGGILQIKYYDTQCDRYRIKTAYVGEDGIKPNTKYCLNGKQQFVVVE